MPTAAAPHSNGISLSKPSIVKRGSYRASCSLSMNGCGLGANGGSDNALGICQTRTLPTVSTPESAVSEMKLAIAALGEDPPRSESGIIRIEVPIRQRADAIGWLQAQENLPLCYFSGRDQKMNLNGYSTKDHKLISVAGVGSAVFFQRFDPFALQDWRCIKRFLSKDSPLIRAYGGIRFDAKTDVSSEWKDFGSFYFLIPQRFNDR